MLMWLGIGFLGLLGMAMIIWRREFAEMQAIALGARTNAGCAVVSGAGLIALVLLFCLLYLLGVIPLRLS